MPGASEKYLRYAVSLVFAGLTVFLGYFTKRTDFLPFITGYGAFFGLYVWLLFFRGEVSPGDNRWYARLGIGLRALLIFSIPNLSDDFYRFLWDGRLTVAGYHPFVHPPVYFIQNHIFPVGITPDLFSKLNSPEYFTVYPPVCQAVFALAALFSPASERGGVVAMKLFLLACEAVTVLQLAEGRNSGSGSWRRRWGYGGRMGVLYALNPLVILEIAGNCHFEGAMICCMVAGLRALERRKTKPAALYWSLATAAKLLPLMFLPALYRWMGRRQGIVFLAVFSLSCLVLFAPLLPVLPNMASSIDLYFRQFQFNASVYYLLRGIGFWIKGYDIGETLGPALGLLAIAGIIRIARYVIPGDAEDAAHIPNRGGLRLTDALLFSLMLQLGLSAAVHPWYATVPLVLGILAGRRFPVWWSGLIALSYSHYAGGGFRENYWLIALEYGVLWACMAYEFRKTPVVRQIRATMRLTLSRFLRRNNPSGPGTAR